MVQTAADVQHTTSFPQIKYGRQALRVLQAILQSSVGGRVAKHLASMNLMITQMWMIYETIAIQ